MEYNMAEIDALGKLNRVNLLDIIMPKEDNEMLRFFNEMLLYNYNPDINGYTLLFMVPPDLSGLSESQTGIEGSDANLGFSPNAAEFVAQDKGGMTHTLNGISRFVTFSAVDFTIPSEQLNTEKISSRSGGIPYATEFTTSEQMSVTYIDDSDLTIYKFHQVWMHYIWDIVEGKIKPNPDYLNSRFDLNVFGNKGAVYQGIDYAAAFYVVKYKPNFEQITYIGKCIGVFPQSLPSKELIGQRTSNELTTLPFSYFCAAYRSEVVSEYKLKEIVEDGNLRKQYWILNEFANYVITKFK